MYIRSFRVKNYKSFLDSREIFLTEGFNVIVGPNNVGKTALIEALSLGFDNRPHRSLETAPNPQTRANGKSSVTVSFEIEIGELLQLLADEGEFWNVPVPESTSREDYFNDFAARITAEDAIQIELTQVPGQIEAASMLEFRFPIQGVPAEASFSTAVFTMDPAHNAMKYINHGTAGGGSLLLPQVARLLRNRIYKLESQRPIPAKSRIQIKSELLPNASNLASVLHVLRSNEKRWDRFNTLVTSVLPEIRRIATTISTSEEVEIRVWTVDPETEREDLAPSLADSGTGVGQVLAILYLLVTAEYPTVIIIDEPQSFLHPGAIRKLFAVLRFERESRHRHQFIVTTHSPTAITAADPQTLLAVHKPDFESEIELVDVQQTQQLQDALAEVGARLGDVFGADSVLWVEGRTEETCYQKIVTGILRRPLLGTTILGVVNTGDFEGKRSEVILEIYERLSGATALLPPAIAFVFDSENRSEKQQADLKRRRSGHVHILPRRTYENYLLNSEAIATLMSQIEDFENTNGEITVEQVQHWMDSNRWELRYFDSSGEQTEERWKREVNAARFLSDMFTQLSETRVQYQKIEHGEWLTDWLIVNSPDDLCELAHFLEGFLPDGNG